MQWRQATPTMISDGTHRDPASSPQPENASYWHCRHQDLSANPSHYHCHYHLRYCTKVPEPAARPFGSGLFNAYSTPCCVERSALLRIDDSASPEVGRSVMLVLIRSIAGARLTAGSTKDVELKDPTRSVTEVRRISENTEIPRGSQSARGLCKKGCWAIDGLEHSRLHCPEASVHERSARERCIL
jgi:hypothetical protein